MPEFLKYLGGSLRRTYDKIVEKPLPWSIIDKLETLDERAAQRDDGDGAQADRSARERRISGSASDGGAKR